MTHPTPAALDLEAWFWSRVNKSGECWVWTRSKDASGYGTLSWRGTVKRAHRVAYEFSNGPIPYGMHALHRCDNRPCVNPAHLFLGTNADNMADMIAKGRHTRGERHAYAKLTDEDARCIRILYKLGLTGKEVGAIYGMHPSTVRLVAIGEGWRHIDEAPVAKLETAKTIQAVGKRVGSLTVVAPAGTERTRSKWLCRCDCGNTRVVTADTVQRSRLVDCGCGLMREARRRRQH